jgi:hypothetical protein
VEVSNGQRPRGDEGGLCPRADCPGAAHGPPAVLAQSLLRPCKGPCKGARCPREAAVMTTSSHGSKRRVPHSPRTGSRGGRVSSRRTVAAIVCAFCLAPPPPLTLLLRGAATQGSSLSRCGRRPAPQPKHLRRRKGPRRAVEGCHSCSAQREGESGHRLVWSLAASITRALYLSLVLLTVWMTSELRSDPSRAASILSISAMLSCDLHHVKSTAHRFVPVSLAHEHTNDACRIHVHTQKYACMCTDKHKHAYARARCVCTHVACTKV